MDPGPGQKSMKKLAVAVAATVLVSAFATAQQAAQPASAQAPPAPPKTAASHPSTKPVAGPPAKATTGVATALSVDAQNQLVKQYCAGCHSDRGKAGGERVQRGDGQAGDARSLFVDHHRDKRAVEQGNHGQRARPEGRDHD